MNMTDDYPTTGNTKYNSLTKLPMFIEWQPSQTFGDLLSRSGIRLPDIELQQYEGEFISYYLSKPGRVENQSRWDSLLVSWITRAQANKANRTGQRNSDSSYKSFTRQPTGADILAEGCAGAFDDYDDDIVVDS